MLMNSEMCDTAVKRFIQRTNWFASIQLGFLLHRSELEEPFFSLVYISGGLLGNSFLF